MTVVDINSHRDDIINFIKSSYSLKPKKFKIGELQWRFAVRSILRGENLLIRGDAGTGKTKLAYILSEILKRPRFVFNLGATQDPRTFLIGKTHADVQKGTFFAKSAFIQAIETENAVILLDELSRAHPAAHNILMSVLDQEQRFLRIDEDINTPVIKVAPGVTFIATANVGSEYTATQTLDRALLDRFSILVIYPLSKNDEIALIAELFPDLDQFDVTAIAAIADETRQQVKSSNPKVDTIISTRVTLDIAGLLADGFTLKEAAEIKIYPFYSDAGGTESPQTYMQQLVQKYIKSPNTTEPTPFFKNNDPNNGAPTPWS